LHGLIRPTISGLFTFKIESSVAISTATLSVDNVIIATATSVTGAIDGLVANSFYDILIDLTPTASPSNTALTLKYQPPGEGSLKPMETDRMYVAFHTLGSPFAVWVAPAPTCSASSTKEGQSISLATAGQVSSFTIQARDQYGLTQSSKVSLAAGWFGNLRDGAGDSFDFALLSGATVPAVGLSASYYPFQDSSKDAGSVAFQGNVTYSNLKAQAGGYQVKYLATAGGMYQLRGKLLQVGGLYAEYYENNDLTDSGNSATSAFNRIDSSINFSWGDEVQRLHRSSMGSLLAPITSALVGSEWYSLNSPKCTRFRLLLTMA